MSRTNRIYSTSGLYHVMLRGINRQQIFFDDEDCEMFLQNLRECKEIDDFQVHAWCLMGNHVHLLLLTKEVSLSVVMKRISTRFVIRYNQKYQRSGHLFQGRFRSEPIDHDNYYMRVFRYIQQNPIKAGMETELGSYQWNSLLGYLGQNDDLTDKEFAIKIFGNRKKLLDFVQVPEKADMMDMPLMPVVHLSDKRAAEILLQNSACPNISAFRSLSMELQMEACRKAIELGASYRQLARLVGISKTVIYRKIKELRCAEE